MKEQNLNQPLNSALLKTAVRRSFFGRSSFPKLKWEKTWKYFQVDLFEGTKCINADGKVRISYSIELTTDQMKRFSTIVEKTNNTHLNFDLDPAGGRGLHSHI